MLGKRSNLLFVPLTIFVAWSTTISLCATQIRADSVEDEYVRQVIEEDQDHYHDEYQYHATDEEAARQQQNFADQEQIRQEKEERAAREASERVAAERERRFEAEVARMNEEQKKLALKQKKIDGKKVRSVLKASERNNLYEVLGIRNLSLKLPPREVNLAGVFRFTIPGVTLLKELSEKDIRKQFRKRAMDVHPDKNRDGRAQEAFVAVEEAASILSDKKLRKQYDLERKLHRSDQVEGYRRAVRTAIAYVWAMTRRTIQVTKTLLGPFFLPVVILAALII
mmetsp:Transcript_8061/g.17360  ORF Transcript_8061/g.17360 Transcript_8061/m.17360 type:complete len:282 (+) Transcript_8061:41-886(+)